VLDLLVKGISSVGDSTSEWMMMRESSFERCFFTAINVMRITKTNPPKADAPTIFKITPFDIFLKADDSVVVCTSSGIKVVSETELV